MALTRKSTGHSAPRKAYVPAPATTTTKTTKTKTKTKTSSKKPGSGSGVTKPKANTSKPRAKATGGRVTKRKPTLKDKAKGAIKKAVGTVERKPGKKVSLWHSSTDQSVSVSSYLCQRS